MSEAQKRYVTGQINGMLSRRDHLGAFAAKLVQEHGLSAIRKLWAMQGLRKQFGTDVLDKAAKGAGTFRDLMQRSENIKADLNQQKGNACQLFN